MKVFPASLCVAGKGRGEMLTGEVLLVMIHEWILQKQKKLAEHFQTRPGFH
ncbi:MAG: hypothetical protein M5R42_07190 [Rhodocyclaceae bacterium]|nr:hypothetical protein [Rhodocyclaceae bacterium]